MKKTILCTVIGSVFSLNASAAVLNVQGEIQVSGKTALATVNLNDYMAPSGMAQNYSSLSYHCSYNNGESAEPVCGHKAKTITITTEGDSYYRKVEKEIDVDGNTTYSNTFTRDGIQFRDIGVRRSKGSYSYWQPEYWVNAGGERIVINGSDVQEGMGYNDCDDLDELENCKYKVWSPADDDRKVEAHQVENHFVDVNTWDQSWTGTELAKRDYNSVIMGIPSAALWMNSEFKNTFNSWREDLDGQNIDEENQPEAHSTDYSSSGDVYNDTFTVIGKVVYNGNNDCIAIERKGDYQIQCRNVGVVFFTEKSDFGMQNEYREQWKLVN